MENKMFIQNKYIIIIFGISFLINTILTLSFAYFIYKWKFDIICDCCGYTEEINKNENNQIVTSTIPINLNAENNFNSTNLKFYSRNTWLPVKPNKDTIKIILPVENVVIAHTATGNCMNKEICSQLIKSIQNYQMRERNFDDISYNFLIGGDGSIYEGRGWDKQPACVKTFNKVTICISLIGNFMETIPTPEQLNGTKMLLEEGIKLGKLTDTYRLYGHRQLTPTLSPGDFLYDDIKNWKHFSKQ